MGNARTPGRGSEVLLRGPILLGSSLIFLAAPSQGRAHLSDGPRCTAGSLLSHPSVSSEEMFAQSLFTRVKSVCTQLDQSTGSPKFLIDRGSAPSSPPQGREIFPRPPKSAVFAGTSSAEVQRESRAARRFHPRGLAVAARVRAAEAWPAERMGLEPAPGGHLPDGDVFGQGVGMAQAGLSPASEVVQASLGPVSAKTSRETAARPRRAAPDPGSEANTQSVIRVLSARRQRNTLRSQLRPPGMAHSFRAHHAAHLADLSLEHVSRHSQLYLCFPVTIHFYKSFSPSSLFIRPHDTAVRAAISPLDS